MRVPPASRFFAVPRLHNAVHVFGDVPAFVPPTDATHRVLARTFGCSAGVRRHVWCSCTPATVGGGRCGGRHPGRLAVALGGLPYRAVDRSWDGPPPIRGLARPFVFSRRHTHRLVPATAVVSAVDKPLSREPAFHPGRVRRIPPTLASLLGRTAGRRVVQVPAPPAEPVGWSSSQSV